MSSIHRSAWRDCMKSSWRSPDGGSSVAPNTKIEPSESAFCAWWGAASTPIRSFHTVSEKLSGKSSADVTLTYAPHHGEQEIRHGPVRQRMGLHQALSSCAHRARTPQDTRFTGDPRRRLLRAQDRLPMEALPKDFPPWKSVYDWFRKWR